MERFVTSVGFHSWYEHWHRYHFVKSSLIGKKVCDIACGEGYGSSLLASVAKSVTGVDIDKKTISNAKLKYQSVKNLEYIQSNALSTPFSDNEFDVLVSFETLEHLHEHNELLNEFKRILKTDGILIISTPDKNVYSEMDNTHNHYHIKELTKSEFNQLTSNHFEYTRSFGQQFQLYSCIEDLQNNNLSYQNEVQYVQKGSEQEVVGNKNLAKYLINICSNNLAKLDNLLLPNVHNFADASNSLFEHYELQIKRLMQLEENFKHVRETISKQNNIINHLKARLGL